MAFYECVLQWAYNSNVFNTVLHYSSGAQGEPDFLELTDDIAAKMTTDYTDFLTPSISFTSARWREDIEGGVGTVYFPTTGDVAGTAADSDAFGQLALIVRKLGSGLVRPNKGRIYQPGVQASSGQASGIWAAAASNAIETFWESMMSIEDETPVTLEMVIKASKPTAPNTVAYNPVVGMQALGNPGTQRRRRLGVGS